MNEIMKFDGTAINVQNINGTWMFDLYAVGMALGQVKKNGRGVAYPRIDRIDENVKNAEIKPCVRNGHKYITESQLYDLMLEMRTDKCRAFRKWLTNEVLPALNRKGSYSINEGKQLTLPIEEKPYEYFDKFWNGEPVLSVQDLAHVMGVSPATIHYYVKAGAFKLGQDYYSLEKQELMKFKMENPKHEKNCNHITLFTKSGFQKLCSCLGTEVDEPKCYRIEMKEEPKRTVVLPSKAMQSLMGYVQREVKAIEGISYLLLSVDTEENLEKYRKLLCKRIDDLCAYKSDIRTILLKLN